MVLRIAHQYPEVSLWKQHLVNYRIPGDVIFNRLFSERCNLPGWGEKTRTDGAKWLGRTNPCRRDLQLSGTGAAWLLREQPIFGIAEEVNGPITFFAGSPRESPAGCTACCYRWCERAGGQFPQVEIRRLRPKKYGMDSSLKSAVRPDGPLDFRLNCRSFGLREIKAPQRNQGRKPVSVFRFRHPFVAGARISLLWLGGRSV